MSERTRGGKRRRGPRAGPPAPRVQELMHQGWCRRDADHLAVVELALTTAPIGKDRAATAVLSQHVGIALAWTPVYAGALELYTGEAHGPTWRRLAGVADGEARERMLRLAAACDHAQVITVPAGQAADLIGEREVQLLEAAQVAEAAGEFRRALELLSRGHWTTGGDPISNGWPGMATA